MLRHSSLQINVIYRITELQSCGHDGELEILIQKIKVVNRFLIHIFREINQVASMYTLYNRGENELSFDI